MRRAPKTRTRPAPSGPAESPSARKPKPTARGHQPRSSAIAATRTSAPPATAQRPATAAASRHCQSIQSSIRHIIQSVRIQAGSAGRRARREHAGLGGNGTARDSQPGGTCALHPSRTRSEIRTIHDYQEVPTNNFHENLIRNCMKSHFSRFARFL